MKKSYDYEKNLQLKHHEAPAIVNTHTGEVRIIEGKDPVNGKVMYDLMPSFQRHNTKAWNELEKLTSDVELKVAYKLARLARPYDNSLIPLSDETTLQDLAETLGVSRNTVKKHMDRLFTLGVVGKFQVADESFEVHKYWIFNPYLVFNGKIIDIALAALFKGTRFAKLSIQEQLDE